MAKMTKAQQHGFTLIEILIAVTITVLLLSTVYGVFTSVSSAKDRLEKSGEGYHLARVIFDRLGREIRGDYVDTTKAGSFFTGGVNDKGNPFLKISTTATTPQGAIVGGAAVVEYELRQDPENPDHKVLMRREYSPLDPLGEEGPEYRLAAGIDGMKLRFFDGANWVDEWQTGLPKIVEVTLTVLVEGTEIPFVTAFEVPEVKVRS
jgi:general secretion pathway protein J